MDQTKEGPDRRGILVSDSSVTDMELNIGAPINNPTSISSFQAFFDPYISTGRKSIRRQLPSSRRHSSSTMSSSSNYKIQQIASFRKVDPEEAWEIDGPMKSIPEDATRRLKNLASSTPNIVLQSAYDSRIYVNVTEPEYQPSTLTPDSQASDRVTIDSDSGYAVSVMNFKGDGKAIKERRTRTRARITQSFRMLMDSGCRNYRNDGEDRRTNAETVEDDDQSYTTRL